MKKAIVSIIALLIALNLRLPAWAMGCTTTVTAPTGGSTATGTVTVTNTQTGGNCTHFHQLGVKNTNSGTPYKTINITHNYTNASYSWDSTEVSNENITLTVNDCTDITCVAFVTPGTSGTVAVNAKNPVSKTAVKGLSFAKYGENRNATAAAVCPNGSPGAGIAGCFMNIPWTAMEPCNANSTDPTNSCYDWTIPDKEITVAKSNNYSLEMAILTGQYGAPFIAKNCTVITFEAGAPTCSAWLGSTHTGGITVQMAATDGGFTQCDTSYTPDPWDSTYRTAISQFEQAFMTRYGGLMGNTIAGVALTPMSDSGDHIRIPYDGGPCNMGAEVWYNSAWATEASTKKSITTEAGWVTEVDSDFNNLSDDMTTNMAYANLQVGIHADDFPQIVPATAGATDTTIHNDVWTHLSGTSMSNGSGWVTDESLPDNQNFNNLVSAYVVPTTGKTWYGSAEDMGSYASCTDACKAYVICSQPNAFSFRHWQPNITNYDGTNGPIPKGNLVINGTATTCDQTGCTPTTCP